MDDPQVSKEEALECVVNHLSASGCYGTLVAHEGSADEVVQTMEGDGWEVVGVEYLHGKRIRTMRKVG